MEAQHVPAAGGELWDLYDGRRRPLGKTHRRGLPLAPGEYHLVVEIWTVNRQGQILLTLRDPQKDAYPGLWEVTGGSALAGETSRRAACRELREETGLKAEEGELTLLYTSREPAVFRDIYLLRRDAPLESLTLQKGETADARWAAPEEFARLLREGRSIPQFQGRLDFLLEKGLLRP
ncbi:MAG TPA: NUDIX domain-containing protein [Candidatus Caccousia avistercoris]|nr:NUDIX domain-containing protein [Candidatus Caccousia avistercoris]